MSATLRPSWYGGRTVEPLPVGLPFGDLSSGVPIPMSITFAMSDEQEGLGIIPVPRTIGTTYSYVQQIALEVIAAAVPPTTLSNAAVSRLGRANPGSRVFFRPNPTFLDQSSGSAGPLATPFEDIGQPVIPPGYDILTDIPVIWDPLGITGNGALLGRATMFLDLVVGVSSSYDRVPLGVPTFAEPVFLLFSYSEL